MLGILIGMVIGAALTLAFVVVWAAKASSEILN